MPDSKLPCPCCGELTVTDPGGFGICPICSWEDDGQGDADADIVRGGPNGSLSLAEARRKHRESVKFAAKIAALRRHMNQEE